MKKGILILVISLGLFTSCAKEWTEADQNTFLSDCRQFAGDDDTICTCGLEKAMKNYSSLEDAQKAIQAMDSNEVEAFFAECL